MKNITLLLFGFIVVYSIAYFIICNKIIQSCNQYHYITLLQQDYECDKL
jgi:hypothetical protein